jgi:putative addiction module component (TIGR02574 family)
MTERARKLLEDALALSDAERAEVAAELLASIGPPGAVDFESSEWATEIERRAEEALADPDGGIPWEQARDEILAELRARRR